MTSERQSNMPQRYFCIRRSPRWPFNSLRWSTRSKRLSGSFNLAGWHLWWHCALCLWLMAAELLDSSRGTVNHFDSVRVCFCAFYVCMYIFLHKCLCIPFAKCIWFLFMSDGAVQFSHSCLFLQHGNTCRIALNCLVNESVLHTDTHVCPLTYINIQGTHTHAHTSLDLRRTDT